MEEQAGQNPQVRSMRVESIAQSTVSLIQCVMVILSWCFHLVVGSRLGGPTGGVNASKLTALANSQWFLGLVKSVLV
jgi:hypothetical protein